MSQDLRYKTGNGVKSSLELMHDAYARCEGMDDTTKEAYLENLGKTYDFERMKDKFHSMIMPSIGLVLFIGMIFLAYFNPFPSMYQLSTFAIGTAFFAGLGATLIPGYFEVKYKGWIRAGGGLGIFVFVYLTQPKTFSNVPQSTQPKIAIQLVPKDTSAIGILDVDFDPNSSDNLCHFVAASISHYTGESVSDTAYTCFRSSNGMIYRREKCKDVKEASIIVISNVVARCFTDKRMAYLHFVEKFKHE